MWVGYCLNRYPVLWDEQWGSKEKVETSVVAPENLRHQTDGLLTSLLICLQDNKLVVFLFFFIILSQILKSRVEEK